METDSLEIIRNISEVDAKAFVNRTSSDIVIKNSEKKVLCDYGWIDIVDDAIPYLDAILHNPRRFLVSEEDIIPVEKVKKVSRESIKHLTQHTSLIQDVDEDGMVHPEKLLNVYKEETFDLYENRFIYSLITRLYDFIDEQMTTEETSYRALKKLVSYEGVTKFKKENVKINLNLETSLYENLDENIDKTRINERKVYLQETVEDFMNTSFMRTMSMASPVKSPIRKTNVILKDQNFKKAVELWDYLDRVEDEPLIKNEEKVEEIKDKKIKDDFDIAYFIDYLAITKDNNVTKEKRDIQTKESIENLIEEYLYYNNVKPSEFKKRIDFILKSITTRKEKTTNNIKNMYNRFISDKEERIKKAVVLLNK